MQREDDRNEAVGVTEHDVRSMNGLLRYLEVSCLRPTSDFLTAQYALGV